MTNVHVQDDTHRGSRPERILCPIDLSEFSQPVLAYAVALGKLFGCEVTALHVFAAWAPAASLGAYPGWMLQVPEARDAILDELKSLVAPLASAGVTCDLRTREGDAAVEIVRAARELRSDLIVIGTHGRSGFDRVALGSVAEKVLRKAPCPVLTLPPGVPRTPGDVGFRRILCPTDFSASSQHAMAFAVSLAKEAGATVTALHVVEASDAPYDNRVPGEVADLRSRQRAAAERALHDVTDACRSGSAVEEVVVLGRPHHQIVRIAEEQAADLIVIGVRGRGSLDTVLFGSTTNQVVRRAPCPVVTIRWEPREEDS